MCDLRQLAGGHHARWVRTGMWLSAAGYALAIATAVISHGQFSWSRVPEVAALISIVTGILLFSSGRIRTGIIVVLAALWLEVHLSIVLYGAARGMATTVLPSFVAATGLLLGGPAAIRMGLLCTISAPLAVAANSWLGGPGFLREDLQFYTVYAMAVMAMAILVAIALRSFGAVLQTAHVNERKYRDLFRNAPEAIIAMDQAGRVEAMNPAAVSILGVTEANSVGRHLEAVAELHSSALDQDALDALAPGEPRVTTATLWREQGRLDCEVTVHRVVRDDGTVGTQLTLRDISVRRAALDRAAQLGRIMEEAMNEVYILEAGSWRILSANRGARDNLGYAPHELGVLAVTDVVPAFTPLQRRELWQTLSRGGVVSIRSVFRRKDGSVYPAELQLHAGAFDGDQVVVVFALDVTDTMRRAGAETSNCRDNSSRSPNKVPYWEEP